MRFLNIFRLPKPNTFNYIPRYYDPDKEDLEDRLKKARLERESGTEAMKSRISTGLRQRGGGNRALRKKMVLRSNLIIIGLIVILLVMVALFLNSYFGRILETLM